LVVAEAVSLDPKERWEWRLIGSFRAAGDEVEVDGGVVVGFGVRWVFEERFDLEAGFFEAFADGRLRGCFAGVDFAAGEFPIAGERDAGGTLADEEAAVVLDDGDGDGLGQG
jgi:hypothetical protein